MYTDNLSVDLPVFMPFEHNLYGAGAIAGVGKIGKASALPVTVFCNTVFSSRKVRFALTLALDQLTPISSMRLAAAH